MNKPLTPKQLSRKLLRAPASIVRDQAIRSKICEIPKGKVATYAQVAAAAGYPLHHRQVVQVLRKSAITLPWQRVVGAGGKICTRQDHGAEQQLRLQQEGVAFWTARRAFRVRMDLHQWTWEY